MEAKPCLSGLGTFMSRAHPIVGHVIYRMFSVDKAMPSSSFTHFVILGIEPAASCMLDMCSTSELHPQFPSCLRHGLAEVKQP